VQRTNKRVVLAITFIVGALLLTAGLVLSKRADAPSWKPAAEGFLAVPTPCCTEASLWDSLDEVSADGQRPLPASAEEAAQWLNEWPYRARDEDDTQRDRALPAIAAQSSEVRCTGAPSGPKVPQKGDDEQTLDAIRDRRECTYAKWKVWAAETAGDQLNERHTVWVDEGGFFHGRVDYWR